MMKVCTTIELKTPTTEQIQTSYKVINATVRCNFIYKYDSVYI